MNTEIAQNPTTGNNLGSIATNWQNESKQILINAHFSEKGVTNLGTESLHKLVQLVASQGTKAVLIKRMFNAVATSNPNKLEKLIDILSNYTGSFSILGQFLNYLKENDPFIATSKAQIIILSANTLPSTRGVSGRVHAGLVYCAYNTDQPTDSVGYFSKKQAITKIFEAFNPERINFANRTKVSNRRTSLLREQLASANLADLVENPESAKIASSQLISRNFEVYQELREAIKLCQEQLAGLTYNGSLLESALKGVKVQEDPGRQLFGWFEEHIKENQNIPHGIKLAYESLRDPDVFLTAQEEKDYLQGLLSYQRLHSYISKSSALEPVLSDIAEYKSLPANSDLRLDPRIESAEASINECLSNSSSEITLTEFGRLIELTGLVAFRRKMNEQLFSMYKEDIDKALELFAFVSFQNGKWREDAVGDSVPMDRLKQHLYGAKIGCADHYFEENKKQATLTQKDFRAIADLQFLQRVAVDPSKFFTSMPIQKFRSMVHGVVVAFRKAQYLDSQLKLFFDKNPEIQESFNKEQVGSSLSSWKPQLLVGNGYQPSEINIENQLGCSQGVLSYSEIYRRISDRKERFLTMYGAQKEYVKIKHNISRVASAGLTTTEFSEFLEKFEEKSMTLTPAHLMEEKLNQATRIVANPMVFNPGFNAPQLLRSKYLFPEEILKINNLVNLEQEIEQACVGHESELAQLREKAQHYLNVKIFVGGVVNNGTRRSLGIHNQDFGSFSGLANGNTGIYGLTYLDPKKLKVAISKIETEFISLSALNRGWIYSARTLCSSEGKEKLNANGFVLVDRETFFKCQGFKAF